MEGINKKIKNNIEKEAIEIQEFDPVFRKWICWDVATSMSEAIIKAEERESKIRDYNIKNGLDKECCMPLLLIYNKTRNFTQPATLRDGKILIEYKKYLPVKQEEFVLMRYTGLKDKNGVEIYEGDVLYKQQFKDIKDFGVVFWRKGRYWVDWKVSQKGIKNNKQQVIGWGKPEYGLGEFPLDVKRCQEYEIIGNIYENPELLEVSK